MGSGQGHDGLDEAELLPLPALFMGSGQGHDGLDEAERKKS